MRTAKVAILCPSLAAVPVSAGVSFLAAFPETRRALGVMARTDGLACLPLEFRGICSDCVIRRYHYQYLQRALGRSPPLCRDTSLRPRVSHGAGAVSSLGPPMRHGSPTGSFLRSRLMAPDPGGPLFDPPSGRRGPPELPVVSHPTLLPMEAASTPLRFAHVSD